MRVGDRDRHDHRIDLAGDHRLNRRRRALKRDMQDIEATLQFEHLHRDVRRTADAPGRECDLARPRLRLRDEIGHTGGGEGGIDDQRIGKVAGDADRDEVAPRVVTQLRIDMRDDGVRIRGNPDEGGAIWRCLGDRGGADRAVGARAVVNDDRLLEPLTERLRHQARHHVAAAACRPRHDQPDGLVGRLGCRRGRKKRRAGEPCGKNDANDHDGLHGAPFVEGVILPRSGARRFVFPEVGLRAG